MQEDIGYYAGRMAEEERLASAAPCAEAAEVHRQIAMLYRAQLDLLIHGRKACVR